MSDAPDRYEDIAADGVRVVTVFDAQKQRWMTLVAGGPLDGWFVAEPDADPVVQHAKAIEMARSAPAPEEPAAPEAADTP